MDFFTVWTVWLELWSIKHACVDVIKKKKKKEKESEERCLSKESQNSSFFFYQTH